MARSTWTGTYSVSDLLVIDNVNISEFGEDTIAEILNRDLQLFNGRISEMLSELTTPIFSKTDRISRYGRSISAKMVEATEYGKPTAQKEKPGVNVGFPMKKYQFALGWTRDYMLNQTPQDAAIAATSAQTAYLTTINEQLQKSLLLATNYTTYDDLVDEIQLDVKRLLNADGMAIPNGPNGESFDGTTHTHYIGNGGTFNNANFAALPDTVTEHGHTTGVRIYINKAQETSVRGFADFEAYVDPRLVFRASDTPARTVDLSNSGNRAIGIFKEAEVWVKPWIPSGYAFCFATGSPRKPLKLRWHHNSAARGLRIASEWDDYPLRAEVMEVYFGFGVWERSNGAVMNTGSSNWVDPTISL
jgi:hypothetical protein